MNAPAAYGLLWKYEAERDDFSHVAMTPDGSRVAVVSYEDGHLEMLDGRGELLWKRQMEMTSFRRTSS